jgi:3-oxoacyl-[acyl-carrier-protein] synthase II
MATPVVVTGMGAVSPLGLSVAQSWEALIAGHTGVGPITHFNASEFSAQVAAEVQGFDPLMSGLEAKDTKKADRFILLGLAAVKEALIQAGLADIKENPAIDKARVAVILGTGIGGLPAMEEAYSTLKEKGPRRVSPFFIPAMLPNLLAGQASILYGLQGANVCPVSACATSAHAIGWGKRLIESGEADVVITGGAEATICATAIAGFAAMRALSTGFNATPARASRPFDAARDGFVMGEGAAVLVLESTTHAARRGATPLAQLTGFGQTADASHMTLASGDGSRRAMELALREAGLQPSQISAINAHATSTPLGDEQEAATIAALFGAGIPTSATKGATGHLLGAAGAIEAVFSVVSLQTGILPPTLNAEHTQVALADIVPNVARHGVKVQHVLSNSFGFGGTNVSLVLSKV